MLLVLLTYFLVNVEAAGDLNFKSTVLRRSPLGTGFLVT